MRTMAKLAIGITLLVLLVVQMDAATPLFLQAITSALGTIPFSGGPMTTGLVGAKLGIGTKLLYYLGYFGRRSKPSTKKKAPTFQKAPSVQKAQTKSNNFAPEGMQPYQYMSGGYPIPTSSFPNSNFQNYFGGVDPSQLFQALTAQGVDPNVAMEALNYAGGMNVQSNTFASNAAFGGFSDVPFGAGGSSVPFGAGGSSVPFGAGGSSVPFGAEGQNFLSNNDFSQPIPDNQFPSPEESDQSAAPDSGASENEPDDAESFFTFLQDMDENTCISRLICDIGHDPSFLGEFSENISSMVGSLQVPSTSRAYKYIEIMEKGKGEGQCDQKFPECSNMSYEVVKNIAPSVSLPQNVNSADINF